MSEQTPTPSGSAWGAFLRGLLRLLMILIVIGLIAAGLYYTLPIVYRELVLPVRETSARLDGLSTQMAGDRGTLDDQLKSIQTRINQLETENAAANSSAADLKSGIDSLRKDQAALQTSLDRLDQLEKELKGYETVTSYNATQVATLEESLRAPGGQIVSLKREVQTLKAMNLLTRAQVNLAQNNFGLAKDDVLAARSVLLALRDTTPAADQPAVDAWIARLDLSLANLLTFPIVASNDLEAAYQLIAAGLMPPAPTPGPLEITPTSTAYVILNEAATVTPFFTSSPTPVLPSVLTTTVTATLTPMSAAMTPTVTPTATVVTVTPTATATATAKP